MFNFIIHTIQQNENRTSKGIINWTQVQQVVVQVRHMFCDLKLGHMMDPAHSLNRGFKAWEADVSHFLNCVRSQTNSTKTYPFLLQTAIDSMSQEKAPRLEKKGENNRKFLLSRRTQIAFQPFCCVRTLSREAMWHPGWSVSKIG